MKIKVIKLKPKRQAPRRVLTLEQIFRYIPKKHRDKFHPTFFDVDHGYDRPLYFVLLKDQYELRPDGTGGISFFTIAEFRDCLDRIVEVQA